MAELRLARSLGRRHPVPPKMADALRGFRDASGDSYLLLHRSSCHSGWRAFRPGFQRPAADVLPVRGVLGDTVRFSMVVYSPVFNPRPLTQRVAAWSVPRNAIVDTA